MGKGDLFRPYKQERIKYINEKLNKGSSLQQILNSPEFANEVSKSKISLQKQFEKAGYSYNNENMPPGNLEKEADIEAPAKITSLLTADDMSRLLQMLESADVLVEMAAWWREQSHYPLTTDDKLAISLPSKGDEVRKTIRISSEIWDAWKAFCQKHPSFSEKDLLAKAILWYIKDV